MHKDVLLVVFLHILLLTFVLADNTPLTLGEASNATFVVADQYLYYTLPAPAEPVSAGNFLVFVLTPLSAGDVDLYISTKTVHPTVSDCEWKSVGQEGLDMVSLSSTQYVQSAYHIGVRAHHFDTTFTITSYYSNEHITIANGMPQISTVGNTTYTYFKYMVSSIGTFTISNTALSGNTDIYVSTNTPHPTQSNYQWKQELEGSDLLQISHTTTTPTWYYIGIRGNSFAAFSLSATSADTITHVAEGYPLRRVVQGYGYQYFKFNLTVLSPVTITVTKRSTFGDPDVYVSTLTDQPKSSNYQWRSFNYGSDSLVIPATSAGFKLGYFYIGIYGDSYFSSTFDIVVKTDKTQIVLMPGRSISMASEQGKYDYYKFFYPVSYIDGALDIAATATSGRVQVVASRTNTFPTLTNAEYVGTAVSGGSSSIRINPVPTGWYYIAVYSHSASNYSIIAATSDDPVFLIDGKPLTFTVAQGYLKPFIFDISDNSLDVSFTLLSQSGDVDLYVGISPRTYLWYSIQSYGADIVTVSNTDPWRHHALFNNRFYIYAHGYMNSTFIITASMGNTTIELLNGIPIAGVVSYSNYTYYRYFMTNPGRLSINLQVLQLGFANADLYVSRRTSQPTTSIYEYKSTRYGPDFLSIDAQPGYYWIGVHGASGTNISFIISATADYETLAANGLSIIDTVPTGTYRYYQVSVPSTVTAMSVGVTLISGATKLYMMNNGSFPSTSSYVRRDEAWPGNVLQVAKTESVWRPGIWILAVYGVDDSLFFIHAAMLPRFSGILRSGEPKIGSALDTEYTHYKFAELTDRNKDYYLNVVFLSYNPYAKIGIYIDQDPNIPSSTVFKWSIEATQNVLIPITKARFTTTGSIVIATKSLGDPRISRSVRFQLTLAAKDEPIFLTQEQPHEIKAESGKAYNFVVYSPRDATGIHIHVASCSDYLPPKFYVSRNIKQPNATVHDFESTAFSKYRQFLQTQGAVPNSIYYIATEPVAHNTTFTIYAYMKNDLRPQPGNQGVLETRGTVAVGHVQLVIPAATSGHLPFQYYVYKRILKQGESEDTINMETMCATQGLGTFITRADVPPNRPPYLYANVPVAFEEKCMVNVVAEDIYKLKAVYKPFFFISDPQSTLKRGYPMRGTVNETEIAQFYLPRIPDIDNNVKLRFIVTPYGGDVDIFVSTKGKPSSTEYEWKATHGGFDIISIDKSDRKFNTGPFYIGIYGVTASEFSLLVHLSNENITLYDSQPQLAVSDKQTYTYFTYGLDDNSTFSISATPIFGDPDIYVSTTTDKPTKYVNEWSSQSSGMDVLSISNKDSKYRANTPYYLGVYGFSTYTVYSLTVAKEFSITWLNEAIPQGGVVNPGHYTYYQFKLTHRRCLIITVTPLSIEGDPDIYVSTFWTRPTSYRSEWSASSQGADTLIISQNDPHWIMGTYYIAVKGYQRQVTFQILAISSESSLLAIDGLPQRVTSNSGQWTYWRFYHGFQENRISFTATPYSVYGGTVELYLSRSITHPTSEKYDKKYLKQGSISYINEPSGSDIGWYYLGAYTPIGTNYSFIASTDQTALLLVDGQMSIQNYVPSGYSKYFAFILLVQHYNLDITIATSIEFGDPDLYVSVNTSRPGPTDYMWKSDRGSADSITIPASEIPIYARRINIGVYGYTASRFSILVHTGNSTQVLQDATSLPGRVEPYRYNQYVYELKNTGRLKFNLQITTLPADADLYVSRQPNPSEARHDYKSQKYGMDFIIIENAPSGKYYIAVHGQRIACSYLLTASTEYEYLTDGQALIEFIGAGKSRLFKTTISSFASHILASVTSINGKTELYGCFNCTSISKETAPYKALQWPGNSLFIPSTDPGFHAGSWMFIVYAIENADFFMGIQTREGRLEAGQPRRGASVNGRSIYYAYTLSEMIQEDHFVNIKLFNNDACVNVFISQDHIRPNATNSKWRGRSNPLLENQSIVPLPKTQLQFYKPLFIAVESCLTQIRADYEIIVNSASEPLYLSQDFATILPYKQMNRFAMLSAKHADQLFMEISSCTTKRVDNHQVGMYVTSNSTVKYPSRETAEFVGIATSGYVMAVKSTIIKQNNVYYMALNAKQSQEEFVFSVFTSTRSSDPRPQPGQLAPGGKPDSSLHIDYVARRASSTDPKEVVNVFKLRFYGASSSRVWSHLRNLNEQRSLIYQVVRVDLGNKPNPNMETVCAIRYNPDVRYLQTILNHTAGGNNEDNGLIETIIELPAANVDYLLNVVVVDSFGLESPYQPIRISSDDGVFQWFSVGGTLILVALVGIIFYLIIGSIFNFLRYRARGLRMLPHINFWTDLPFLVIEGFYYSVTCCRRQRTYETLVDEETIPNEDVDAKINPFKVPQMESNEPSSTGSTDRNAYGEI